MRASDRIFLETLRAGVGSTVDESTWGLVEKQVAESGVRGLTGSARMVVESLVAKHGGSSHNQKTHAAGGGGGGGESSSGGSNSGSSGGGKGGSESLSLADYDKLNVQAHEERRAELEATARDSFDTIKGAKSGGLQPMDSGLYVPSTNNQHAIYLSNHGSVMRTAAIRGGTPRVVTTNGATARIKGWKHRDALESGDVVALDGSSMKSPTFRIDGVSRETRAGRVYAATPIGKKGKATGKPVELFDSDLGGPNGAVTIVQPVVRS
jgi:hypothetical protein